MTFTPARTLVALAIAAAPFAASAEGLSFNIGAVSLYKLYGVDQNTAPKDDRNTYPAIQGGVDYEFANGFYVGNWNSTGRFDNADVEIDLYAGYRGEIAGGLSYDIGYAHYFFPGQSDWNSGDLSLGLNHGPFGLKVIRGMTSDVNRGDMRYAFSYEHSLTDALGLTLIYAFRNKANANGNENFNDYAVRLTYDLGNDLSVSGSISGATSKTNRPERNNRLVLGVSKSF